MHSDLPYMIALSKINNIGPVTAKSLISYCGSAEAVFKESKNKLRKIPQVGPQVIGYIENSDAEALYSPELIYSQEKAIKIISYRDSAYPERLKQVQESPIVIYYRGEANLNAKRMLAIVGTRKPSHYGLTQCEKILADLEDYNISTISGLAYGIDACAHKQSLKHDIPTIGIMGTSFETLYPASHRNLAVNMLEKGGILTEFPTGTRLDKENFPMRNRIIAGMSDGLLVIESAERGGSMISATFAHAYNKEVFALPGKVNDDLSKGCNLLIKTHRASLIRSGDDIAECLSWNKDCENPISQQHSLFEPLIPIEQELIDIIQQHPNIHIDKLVSLMKISPGEVAAQLLQLEFKGIIKTIPGKQYMLV